MAPSARDGGDPLVVVVSYGRHDLLRGALDGLSGRFPVVVVDNAGSASCRDLCAAAGAGYLEPGANIGFAAAVNLAMDETRPGQDLLLLNPDAVLRPEGVTALSAHLHADDRLACVAPAQQGGRQGDRVAWPLPSPAVAWLEALGMARFLHDRPSFLIGSVLLLRAEAISDVGVLDERYFLYGEEADWQRRALERGWEVRYCEDVTALHIGAATSADDQVREALFHGSVETFVRKWHGRLGWQSFRLAVVLGAGARALVLRGRRRRALSRARLYLAGPARSARRARRLLAPVG